MKFELNDQNRVSESFDFRGDCYISISGSGTVSIERKIGEDYLTLTNDRGELLSFIGEGVIFNDKITCNKPIPHRFVADTTDNVIIEIMKERG